MSWHTRLARQSVDIWISAASCRHSAGSRGVPLQLAVAVRRACFSAREATGRALAAALALAFVLPLPLPLPFGNGWVYGGGVCLGLTREHI